MARFQITNIQPRESNSGDLFPINSHLRLLLGDSVDQGFQLGFDVPSDFSAGTTPNLIVKFYCAAITGNFGGRAQVECVTPGDAQNMETPSFDTANLADTTAPGTTNNLKELSIPLTNRDSMAANDACTIFFERNTGVTGNLTGDVKLVSFALDYTQV